ncbi:hypothetical protein JJL56_28055 [Azospirillum sp. YIM DDC1]|uniref:Uncharacterized protein n=1 Tax=Azospirillum aestuarii TaxID=2802052 RepID=A0ABS1I6R8_9PROT|nr:hypothetical protein [Azospirillum aestuarii]MBK4722715.1 hypothetical protein [Azospirillum aestuarii]
MAGPDSTSIRPPPVGSAPLRASSAARADTSDVSARALLLDSNATIDGSRITGVVQNARTSLEANQANGLASGATIDGSQVTGTVANAARSQSSGSADYASQIWDARTNTWQWVNNVSVTRADSSGYSDTAGTAGTAGQANQLYNNYTGGYDWASNLRVGYSENSERLKQQWAGFGGPLVGQYVASNQLVTMGSEHSANADNAGFLWRDGQKLLGSQFCTYYNPC